MMALYDWGGVRGFEACWRRGSLAYASGLRERGDLGGFLGRHMRIMAGGGWDEEGF
jgi:hypothetical protein